MDKKIIQGLKIFFMLVLLAAGRYFMGSDMAVFVRWWLMVLILGLAVFPLTKRLFENFYDKGWLVSKVLGIALTGFTMWFLGSCRLLPFTPVSCVVIVCVMAAVLWGCHLYLCKKEQGGIKPEKEEYFPGILDGELVFLALFLIWTYFSGFHPEAYGTEKFMDYGFMMSMMRSEAIPAPDLWFAGEPLNYYYGGQYFGVFLTKLTGTEVKDTYNIMRTLVAVFAFALPFVLVRQMILDFNRTKKKSAVFAGLLAGTAVCFSGNMHYVMVGKILPFFRKVLGLPEAEHTYWFPNSTRYIGYYPAGNDKTIHEFPSYSFVLGDLHAHVVNVMFVLTVICLIYALVTSVKKETEKPGIRQIIMNPYVWLFSFFIGLFHWTNYWDFVIYYVMGGMGVIYSNYLATEGVGLEKERLKAAAAASVIHSIQVLILSGLFALPFTLQFHTMVSGVALAQNHSRPYQWWLIWGLPLIVTVLFMFYAFKEKHEKIPQRSDFYGIILGVSAIGLIVIPEIVYVRDIYEKEFARSNTMFKLTYQAFIMFGILMAYAFVRLWLENKTAVKQTLTTVGFVCFAACACYGATAIHSWFGQVWDKDQYQGLDASAYLEEKFPEDARAIRWLNENVEGTPVVLEANGDSYSDYERVSSATGLPTVLGWYVHEWLWRGDLEEINQRVRDVESIYRCIDEEKVRQLVDKYEIKYIFVGKMEKEKFPDMDNEKLKRLGKVVYEEPSGSAYIIEINGKTI